MLRTVRIWTLLLIAAPWWTVAVAQATFCAPPSPPPAEPPQQGPHPQCETCESYCRFSPCYVATGVYTTQARDLTLPTAGFPLAVSRSYESHNAIDGPMGVGWRSSLTARVNNRSYLLAAPNTFTNEVQVVLPNGWTIAFQEQPAGVFTPSAAGRRDTLVHNADGTWVYSPPNSRGALRFNVDGTIASMADEFDNRVTFSYDANGRLQQIADAAGSGRTLTVTWGSDGRISAVADSSTPARYVKYHYNAVDGSLTGVDDPVTAALTNEHAINYIYTAGRFGPVMSSIKDRWNRVISSLEWYPSGKLKSYTEGEYNDANPPASAGEKYVYTYHPSDTVKAHSLGSRQYMFGPTGVVNHHAQFNPATGLATSTVDDHGYSTTYEYNARGNVTKRTVAGLAGTTVFNYTYDTAFPDQVSSIISSAPAQWPGLKYRYWPAGQPGAGALKEVGRLRKNGTTEDIVEAYGYNSRGQVTTSWSMGESAGLVYNAAGDITTVSTAASVTTYDRDSAGRVTRSVDTTGQATTYTYDALDRIKSVTLPKPSLLSTLDFTTQYSYDNYDAATGLTFTHITDPNGRVTRQGYDALGRLVRSVDALQKVTTYSYQYGLLKSVTDANGNVTTYSYDANRNLASTTFPDAKVETYTTTESGALTQVTDRRGISRTYTYNEFGALKQLHYPANQHTITYTWLGELLAGVTEGSVTDTIEYDDSFRMVRDERFGGYKLTWDYGPDAHPAALVKGYTVTPPQGSPEPPATVSWDHDGSRRVIGINAGSLGVFTYTYAQNGQYDTITFPNGQQRKYEYDLQGRLTRVANRMTAGGGSEIVDFDYAYDYNWATSSYTMLGQRTSVSTAAHADTGLENGLTTYQYDAAYQLTRAAYPGGVQQWTYDDIGNRLSMTTNGFVTNYNYVRYPGNPNKDSSRLQSIAGSGQTLAYDANGNVTSFRGTYAWDHANRLVSFGGEQFAYDYRGRRTQAGPAATPTTFVYQGMDIVRERNAAGLRDDYVYGPGIDEPLAKRSASGAITYFAVDGLGSIVAEVEGTAIVDGTQYDAFGDFRPGSNPPSRTRFAYTGREYSGGMYYYRARYYDALIGRFISEDPIDSTPGRSSYAYVRNSPIDLTDPFGLQACYREPNCNDINRDIENLVNEMRRWLSEFRDDSLPLSGRNSVRGHQKRFGDAQGRLQKLLEKHRRHHCMKDPPPDAEELATRGIPNPRPLPPRHRFQWEQLLNDCCNYVLGVWP